MSMELINELQRADVALQAARNANNAAFEDYQTAKADRDGLQEMTTDYAIACTHVKRAETIHSATCNGVDTAFAVWKKLYDTAVCR